MERTIQRVLVACRGEEGASVGRRIEAAGLEAVALYADADAEDTWLDEVAYAARIATDGDDPYRDGLKIVSAALDAGCDAVHPGTSPVALSAEHAHMVMNVGLAWIGSPPAALEACADRAEVRRRARELGLPVVPASPALRDHGEVAAWIGKLGGNVRVTSTKRGKAPWLTGDAESLQAALRRMGDDPIVVERDLRPARHVVFGVVGDGGGSVLVLGDHERSLVRDGVVRVRESPAPALDDRARARIAEALPKLVASLGLVGVGAVEILVGEGRWWVHDVVPALFPGFALHEEIYGLDLVHAQARLAAGETLGWSQEEIAPAGCGMELTLCATEPGVLEDVVLPEGVAASTVRAVGATVDVVRDPVLARMVVAGPMRHAVLVRARAALEETRFDGVPDDTAALAALLAEPRVWEGQTETGLFASRAIRE